MLQSEDYIYSKSAVARMLNVAVDAVTRLEKWPLNKPSVSILFIIVKGKRPRFWKKLDFLCHFADWRRSQSKELLVDHLMPNVFAVINEKKKSKYVTTIKPDSVSCNCEDYKNQVKFLKKPGVCKHGYAVLKNLGVLKLSEYIKDNIYQQALDNYKKKNAFKLAVMRTDAYSFSVQDSKSIYYCDLHPSIIKCTCTRYDTKKSNSEQFCTHGYAVLSYLGFRGNQQIKDYQRAFDWIVDDYNIEQEGIEKLNQAIKDEEEEADRLAAEQEAIEAAKIAEEQDAKDCLFTAQSWSL
jgi:hypothetical protein